MSTPAFHDQVIAILPKLRVQALALTRNRASAEDLVQDAVCNALSASNSFIPGTNFAAWMHRILRNRFISNLRKRRDTTDIDDVPAEHVRHRSCPRGSSGAEGTRRGDDPSAGRSTRGARHGRYPWHELRGSGRGDWLCRRHRKEPGIPGAPPARVLADGRDQGKELCSFAPSGLARPERACLPAAEAFLARGIGDWRSAGCDAADLSLDGIGMKNFRMSDEKGKSRKDNDR